MAEELPGFIPRLLEASDVSLLRADERVLEAMLDLARVGATIRYGGTAPAMIIGNGEQPWWDAILIVEYPSPAAFVDMVTTEEYAKVHEHRAAALERGDLIATSTWSVAD